MAETAHNASSQARQRKNASTDLHDEQDGQEREPLQIKKLLSLADGTLLIIGMIIGSGIFISPKGVLSYSGSVGAALIIWAACGIFSMLGALCMAELGTTIPKFGGEYIYIHEAFGALPAFLYLWVLMVILKPTTQAIIMLTFAEYVVYPVFIECDETSLLTKRLLAVAGILFLTFVNVLSVRWSAHLTNILSYSKLLATFIIIITGVYYLAKGYTDNFEDSFAGTTKSVGDIALAMYSGLWAYSGWNVLNNVTEEMKNIKRYIPLSSTVQTFAQKTLGVMAWVMPLFVALSTLGAANASIFTAGRVYFSGAREGQLPDVVAMIHIRRRTPVPAILINCVVALIMVQISDIDTLTTYFSFISWLVTGIAVAGLITLRWTKPNLPRPIKLPIFIPALFVVMSLFLVIVPFYTRPIVSSIGVGLTLTGVPLYFLGVLYKRKRMRLLSNILGSITWLSQVFLEVSITDART
uniref:Y+L amino acid transporter 2-like n=1 Tax=Saccoglossus kowalevskii TaxID=10224 RepID=A0ABM0MBM3_SACKO|nr:PREDICTED: Y+L amino acid transporter 2-like [Saccoglossus kowalevskii]